MKKEPCLFKKSKQQNIKGCPLGFQSLCPLFESYIMCKMKFIPFLVVLNSKSSEGSEFCSFILLQADRLACHSSMGAGIMNPWTTNKRLSYSQQQHLLQFLSHNPHSTMQRGPGDPCTLREVRYRTGIPTSRM